MTAAPPPVTGPGQHAAVVLFGDQVIVGTQWVVSGRVRLRRHVITETVMIPVVVRREELVVETMDVAAAPDDPDVWRGTAVPGPAPPLPRVGGRGPPRAGGPPAARAGGPPVHVVLRREIPDIGVHVEPYELATARFGWQTEHVPVTVPTRREDVAVETAQIPPTAPS